MTKRKLTAADVMYIRRSKADKNKLAEKFGISRSTLECMLKGRSYTWVKDENSVPPAALKQVPRDEMIELIEAGTEWDFWPPTRVVKSIKSLKAAGVNVKRYVRYEIVDDDY